MNNSNKTVWIVVGAVIVIVIALIVWGVMASKKGNTDAYQNDDNGSMATTTQDIPGTEDVTAGSVSAGSSVTLSYSEALAKYAKARLQIGANCQVTAPNNITVKSGSSIMIDNRSSATHSVKVGSVYTVKGYGFKIVNVSYKTLPATFLVDCDGSQNVATILIQK